jgi:hypothetical protein
MNAASRRSALIAIATLLQGCCVIPELCGRADATISTPPSGSVWFIEPRDGATVYTPVLIKLGVSGYHVHSAGPGNDRSSGHHHVIVGTGPVPNGEGIPFDAMGATTPHFIHWGMGQTEAMVNLPLGRQTLTAQFADGNHLSYGPAVSAQITVTVVGVDVAPPPPKTTTTPPGTPP